MDDISVQEQAIKLYSDFVEFIRQKSSIPFNILYTKYIRG